MSTPDLHAVRVPRTAHVATLGTPAAAETWWVALHGYGQRAADFAEQCATLTGPDRAVVAPEALSRFYVDGLETHETVGASWMTRAAREDEIADYVEYLDTVVRRLRPDRGNRKIAGEEVVSGLRPEEASPSICVLGFSQGAATASRWALLGDTAVDRLVLWGGAPAHDLDLSAHAERLRAMDLTWVVGTDDPYVTEERRAAVRRRLDRHDLPVTERTFEGGHRLDDETLRAVGGAA
jgi:predicted esterase